MPGLTWINTFSGVQFYPLTPRLEDIRIVDIATALANQCRFSGHTKFHYSVAQHSVLASDLATPAHKLELLLHDAEEAYMVDVPRPLKYAPGMEAYVESGNHLRRLIFDRFGLPPEMGDEAKEIDNRLMVTEAHQLIPARHPDWLVDWAFEPYPTLKIMPQTPEVAKAAFLRRFYALYPPRTLEATAQAMAA